MSIREVTRRSRRAFAVLLQGCVVCLPAVVHAAAMPEAVQGPPTAAVTGIVVDATGQPIAGASVTMDDGGASAQASAETTDSGRSMLQVIRGVFVLRASAPGYATLQRRDVAVRADVDVGQLALHWPRQAGSPSLAARPSPTWHASRHAMIWSGWLMPQAPASLRLAS